jgi:hypothetical protein
MKILLILALLGIGCGEVDAIHVPDAGGDATASGGKGGAEVDAAGGTGGRGVDAAGGHQVEVDAGQDTLPTLDSDAGGAGGGVSTCRPTACNTCVNGVPVSIPGCGNG